MFGQRIGETASLSLVDGQIPNDLYEIIWQKKGVSWASHLE